MMSMEPPSPLETPSGKSAAGENFPVGSWLIPKPLRPHVHAFYDFARAVDDIADTPELRPEEKCRRLDGFEAVLLSGADEPGYEKAARLARSLAHTGVSPRHGRNLIAAFRQDAVKSRYDDWSDLIAYCRLSAAPVGRYLIDLHGDGEVCYPASDALCAALQVINHVQDCADDYRVLDRVYLPGVWLDQAGIGVAALGEPASSPALRRVFARCLDGCRVLMAEAEALPGRLSHRRLALESGVIVALANALIERLSTGDPLAERVKLSRFQVARASASGLFATMLRRA